MLFPSERGIEGETRGLSKPCPSTRQIVLLFHGNYFPLRLFVSAYLTIILRGRAGYEMIDNQRGA